MNYLIRKVVRQTLTEMVEANQVRPLYAYIELDDESQMALKQLGEEMLLDIEEFEPKYFCHHMTIAFGKDLDDETLQWALDNQGREYDLIATHLGASDKAIGVKVYTNAPCKNKTSHVTIATNLRTNGKPVETNYIQDWHKLPNNINMKGTVQLFYPQPR